MGTLRIEPEISAVSVVLVGEFNPAMLTPAWLAYHRILSKQEASSVNEQILIRNFSSFSSEWLNLQADNNRVMAAVSLAPYIRLRDFLLRIFEEQLLHTPIQAIGINRDVHFLAPTADHRDAMGRRLAPLAPWEGGASIVDFSGKHSGLTALEMVQGTPSGRPIGDAIRVRVEPSIKTGQDGEGVYVAVNDHFNLRHSDNGSESAGDLSTVLQSRFEESIRHSDQIIDYVMSLAKNALTH
ncbi:MAG: hypothetical protein OXI38_11260 [Bacteroidota bacterium]|nr:hypothetical protein [Bacteroidota bacterium]